MKKAVAERYRDIDFSHARRGALVKPEPGKTKISIRLTNAVPEYFRNQVDKAGGGNYQTVIDDALLEHIHRRSALGVVRKVLRDEPASYRSPRTPRREGAPRTGRRGRQRPRARPEGLLPPRPRRIRAADPTPGYSGSVGPGVSRRRRLERSWPSRSARHGAHPGLPEDPDTPQGRCPPG